MSRETVIREWKGDSAGGFTAVCQRTASGRWVIGTRGSAGNWANDALEYATDQQAMEWLESRWGYLPGNAREFFPAEMVD